MTIDVTSATNPDLLSWVLNATLVLPEQRTRMCVAILPDSTLYLVAGSDGNAYQNNAYKLDPTSQTWTNIVSLTNAFPDAFICLNSQSVITLDDRYLFISGWITSSTTIGKYIHIVDTLNDTYLPRDYNVNLNSAWHDDRLKTVNITFPIAQADGCTLSDSESTKMFIVGGANAARNVLQIYNMANDAWTLLDPSLPLEIQEMGCLVFEDRLIVCYLLQLTEIVSCCLRVLS